MLFTPLKIYKIPQFTAFSLSHTHTHIHTHAHTHTHTHTNTIMKSLAATTHLHSTPEWRTVPEKSQAGTISHQLGQLRIQWQWQQQQKKSALPPRALPEFWGQQISCAKYLSSQHGWTEYLFLYFTNWICSLCSLFNCSNGTMSNWSTRLLQLTVMFTIQTGAPLGNIEKWKIANIHLFWPDEVKVYKNIRLLQSTQHLTFTEHFTIQIQPPT